MVLVLRKMVWSRLNPFKQPAMEEVMDFLAMQEIHGKAMLNAAGLIQSRRVSGLERPFEAPQIVLEL